MPLLDNILLGMYIGVLTGVFAAIIVYLLTFIFTYLAGAKLSVNYALMIGLGIAGVAGGPRLLLRNPELLQSATSLVMLFMILLITFYAHQKAQDLGKSLPPKTVAMDKLRKRTLASSVIKQVGHFGQVTVRPTGEVTDIEGYPSLPDELRAAIRTDSWTFPSDLPIAELESRLEEKLKQDYYVEDTIVHIDSKGRATISAAPSIGGFSRRVPDGKQVVTVEGILPEGLAEGDTVKVSLNETTITGDIISVKIDEAPPDVGEQGDVQTDNEAQEATVSIPVPDEAAIDGTGRVAIAINPETVKDIVEQDLIRLYARSRGQMKEFEFVSLLRQYDLKFRKFTLPAESEYPNQTLGELNLRDTYGVVVVALKRANKWRFAPDHTVRLEADDELFVTGPKTGLDSLREMVA